MDGLSLCLSLLTYSQMGLSSGRSATGTVVGKRDIYVLDGDQNVGGSGSCRQKGLSVNVVREDCVGSEKYLPSCVIFLDDGSYF